MASVFGQALPALDRTRIACCQNCEWSGDESALMPIADVFQRVSPGEEMPAGECPVCSALAHIEEA
jgi:hypothetical protein